MMTIVAVAIVNMTCSCLSSCLHMMSKQSLVTSKKQPSRRAFLAGRDDGTAGNRLASKV